MFFVVRNLNAVTENALKVKKYNLTLTKMQDGWKATKIAIRKMDTL